MLSFVAHTHDTSQSVGSVPQNDLLFHVNMANSPNIKDSMLMYATADQQRGLYDIFNGVAMYSNLIKNQDAEAHDFKLGTNFVMFHNDCGIGSEFMSYFNSSGVYRSITMYNSKARQSNQLAMYDSKVLAAAQILGANIAMWNSTIPDNTTKSEIALWNRKVVITEDGFINGMKITQLQNKLNGQYPNEMTVETDVIYIQ